MFTQKECILMNILDCGWADLDLLEDIGYDLNDIIDDLKDNGHLSLNCIFIEVFERAGCELRDAFGEQRNDIELHIIEELENIKRECLEDGWTEEELYKAEDYQEVKNDLELLTSNQIDPEEDLDYYCNCLDTHVYLKNLDFYRKYMFNTIDKIEDNMGFEFED